MNNSQTKSQIPPTAIAIIVATIIEGSYAMFGSLIGTWIPFGSMFLTTYLIGSLITKRKANQVAI